MLYDVRSGGLDVRLKLDRFQLGGTFVLPGLETAGGHLLEVLVQRGQPQGGAGPLLFQQGQIHLEIADALFVGPDLAAVGVDLHIDVSGVLP